jgi:hypothetical protein
MALLTNLRLDRAPRSLAATIGYTVVRIASRLWSPAHVAHLILLLDSGASAAVAAVALRRPIVIVKAKARHLGRHFPILVGSGIAENLQKNDG